MKEVMPSILRGLMISWFFSMAFYQPCALQIMQWCCRFFQFQRLCRISSIPLRETRMTVDYAMTLVGYQVGGFGFPLWVRSYRLLRTRSVFLFCNRVMMAFIALISAICSWVNYANLLLIFVSSWVIHFPLNIAKLLNITYHLLTGFRSVGSCCCFKLRYFLCHIFTC